MVVGIKFFFLEVVWRLVLCVFNKRYFFEVVDGGLKVMIVVIYYWGIYESFVLIDVDMMMINEDGLVFELFFFGSVDDLML